MRIVISLSLIVLAGALSACGSGTPQATASDTGSGSHHVVPPSSDSGNASAEEVARQMRGDVTCPAHVPKPERTPVVDVVGVRPGMTYAQAADVVMCSNPLLVVTPASGRGYDIQTYGQTIRQGFDARFAEPRVHKTSRQIMQEMEREATARAMNAVQHDMKPGQTKWFVSTMGMPGQETVISAAREEWFAEGHNPTVDSLQQALIAKYGTPTQTYQGVYRQLRWAYDPRGRLITETSPLYNRCNGVSDPDQGTSLSADCGIVVAAMIQPLRSNPGLAEYLQSGVVDQAGGYQSLAATKQALQSMDAARRAKQVREAAKNVSATQL